jgi:hypothetical protein
VADSYIPFWNVGSLIPGSPDLKFDAETLTVGANTVLRERVEITGSGAAEIARVLDSAPAGTEHALVTRNIPSGTQAVSGPLTDTQLRATAVPVSGTVTANLGTVAGVALDATLTGGAAKSIVRGGAKGGTAAADITGSSVDADHQALDVWIRGGAAAGGTSMVDDAIFTPGSTAFAPAGGTFRTVRDLVDDGDGGAFAMTSRRALLTSLESAGGQAVNVAITPNPDWTLGGLQVALHGVIAGDTSFGGTEYGLPLFAKRHDANSSLASVDGRFAPVQMSALGNLKVALVEGGGSGGTAMVDDAAFTVGSTSVTPIAGIYKSTLDSVDDGDAGALAMTQKRALYVSHLTPAGDSMVDDTASIDALQVTLMTMAQVIGSVAHDSPDTQPPVKIGGRASTSLRTAVADDDRVDGLWDVDGALVTRRTAHSNIITGNALNTDGTSTQVIAAQAAGVRSYITDIELTNTHATAFAYVEIKDGTTVVATLPVPPVGGVVKHYDPPLRGTAATAWNFDPSAATTTLICSMHGYTSKS